MKSLKKNVIFAAAGLSGLATCVIAKQGVQRI